MLIKNRHSIKSITQHSSPAVIKMLDGSQNYQQLLQQKCHTHDVRVLQRPKSLTNASSHGSFSTVTVQHFFDECAKSTNPEYDWIILHELATDRALREEILSKQFIGQFPSTTSFRLWVTPQHSFTGAHFDSCETFNLQLFGQKKFILYPPGVTRYKARNPFTKFGHTSIYNDFETVTDCNNWQKNLNNKIEFTLQPGDMIYIPPGWWHQVYNDSSIGMNVLINFSAGKKLLKHPYVLVDLLLKKLLTKNRA